MNDTTLRFPPILFLLAGLSLVAVAPDSVSAEESAEKIVEQALETNSLEFESGRAEVRLTIGDRNGDRSEREMTIASNEIDGAVRTLIELTGPEELKGQSFLFAENEGGGDDVWMYVPAFEVTRRIEGNKKQGAFLGSHFTYNDLESRDVARAEYTKRGSSTIGDNEVHVIEARPTSGADSEYGKVITYIRKSDKVPLKFKFYDESDELLKTLFVEKLDDNDDGETYIKQMQMRSEKGGYTRIVVDSITSGVEIPDAKFTKDQLGK